MQSLLYVQRKKQIHKILLILLLTSLSVIFLFPFFIMLMTSFKSAAEFQQADFTLLPKQFTLSNYTGAMTTGNWSRYFFNSTFITVIVTSVSVLLNSMAAYAFSRLKFPLRNFLFAFSLIAMLIPEQVIMIPVFLRLRAFPLAGGNDLFGLGGTGLLNTYWGMMIPFIANPFGVFFCRQAFISFPKSLDEAAILDGCSKFRVFWSMYLPLSVPTLVTLGLLKAVATWNQYTWPLILTSSDNMKTVQLALSKFSTEFTTNWGYLLSATTLILLPVVLIFLFFQRYYVSGIMTSGIKG